MTYGPYVANDAVKIPMYFQGHKSRSLKGNVIKPCILYKSSSELL